MVKSKLKTRTKIPNLTKADGSKACTSKEKADVLNAYFGNVYKEETGELPQHKYYSGIPLTSIVITQEMVLEKLNSLNPGKSMGLDGWHTFFLHRSADILCDPLLILFTKSLKEGIVPPGWLEACITVIHKKCLKTSIENYRPVSITSVICKMMESIIRDNLVSHMLNANLFADKQHGFVPNRDCVTNLLLALEDWSEAIEFGNDIDIIYTDFAKAFDSVPHKRLILKFTSSGIEGDVLQWIKSFLTGRRHRVTVDGELSDWVNVISGIPQGSVLGPTLFVIFINDMPDVAQNCLKLFADDAKLYGTIRSEDDVISLQNDINNLTEWSKMWQLPFNVGKCKCMHIGKGKNHHSYQDDQNMLENVKEEKDLGVIFDNQLKFHMHTSASVKKANSILGIIKRLFVALDEDTLHLLFTSMVRPHLEYANIIWGPHFIRDVRAVEQVQKRATKLVPLLRNVPYRERLKKLNLPSLEHRRKRGDMITCYKIVTGKVNVGLDNFFLLNKHTTRVHNLKILKSQQATKQVRQQSFPMRMVNIWNGLPSAVVHSDTVNQFKNKLDAHRDNIKFDSVFT